MKSFLLFVALSALVQSVATAFSSFSTIHHYNQDYSSRCTARPTRLYSQSNENSDSRSQSFLLTNQEIRPLLTFGTGDSIKLVNAFGLWCAVASILTGPIWSAAMTLANIANQLDPDLDPNRAWYDQTGKVWAKVWLTLTDSYPTMSGNAITDTRPCLYVANHASWLDIPVICTVLSPVFKFIAKGELKKVPCIGQQLVGGNHILIDRDDRRSQLRTFKDGIGWLQKGVPIMAFPEGMRSRDGRLMEFKGGLFSMAVKTKVPIIPITISHAHAVMPGNSFFPVQSGKGKLHVHVHDAISTEGKTEAELSEMVRTAFLSTLPFYQHPLPEKSAPSAVTSSADFHGQTVVQDEHSQPHEQHSSTPLQTTAVEAMHFVSVPTHGASQPRNLSTAESEKEELTLH